MKKILLITLLSVSTLCTNFAYAGFTLDRTRIVYKQNEKIADVIVSGESNSDAILIQSWVEDENFNKIKTPIVALPLLQRLDPGKKKQVKISTIGDTSTLAQDKETLLYFNVLEVPQKKENGEGASAVKLIMQTRIKLFYRPASLNYSDAKNWQEALEVNPLQGSVLLKNPTPYHIIIMPIMNKQDEIKEIIVKPFSSVTYKTPNGKTDKISLAYIDDVGGLHRLTYKCNNLSCMK